MSVGARRVVADIAIQIVGMVANIALGVVVTAIIARHLGDARFGQWSTILAVISFAGFSTDLGLRQIVVRQIALQPDREPQWLGAQLSLVTAITVPVTLVAAGVLAAISRGSTMLVAGLISALIVMQAPVGNLGIVFQLRTRNDITTAITTLRSVLWAAAVIVVSVTGGGLVALAVWYVATSSTATLLTGTLAARRVRLRPSASREGWSELLRLALPAAIAGFLSLGYGRIDQILVFLLAGSRDAGLYGAVYRVLDQIQFIPVAVLTTLTPMIATAYAKDRESLRTLVEQAATYLSVASFGALAVTLAAGRPIVHLLYGHAFVAAAPALPILMGAFVAICFGYLVGAMIVVLGAQGRNAWLALAALVVNVGLNAALVPRFGFKAAAWVTLATELLWLALASRLVMRELRMRLDLHRLPRVMLAAAVMGGAVAGARAGGVGVVGLLLIALGAYAALLLAMRAIDVAELTGLLRRGRG